VSTVHHKRLSSKAIEEIRLRRDDRVITACGCLVIPGIVFKLQIDNRRPSVECSKHGLQKIIRKATGRESINHVLGLPLDYTPPPVPDEPPF
jgi:hypothetical protein